MSRSASWHAPMPTSKRKRRNRIIAAVVAVAAVVLALVAWFVVPRATEALPEQQSREPDSSAVASLVDSLDAEDYLEVEGATELGHVGKQLAVGGYRKSDGTVVGTIRGADTSVSFVDTGAEVFLRTAQPGWALLGVEGSEEMWARSDRGLVTEALIIMPFSAVREATSGDFTSVSESERQYANGTSLSLVPDGIKFTNAEGRSFSYFPPRARTSEGLEAYVTAATKTQAEVLRDGERTWLRLPDGYVPTSEGSADQTGATG